MTSRRLRRPAQSRAAGLDVQTWLSAGWLDLLIVGGGVTPYSPTLKTFIDMAHRHGVPAYPCINHFREPLAMRSMAGVFHALGGDGVYIFNYAGVPDSSEKHRCLSQLGTTPTLGGFDMRFPADTGFADWGYGHERLPSPFPVRLVAGAPIRVVAGPSATDPGATRRVTVTCTVVRPEAQLRVLVNGLPVPPAAVQRVDEKTFAAELAPEQVRVGINQVVVLPGPGAAARIAATITGVVLTVEHPTVPGAE